MAATNAEVQWLQGIKGLNDSVPPGSRREVFTGQPGVVQVTPDLLNVKARFGNIMGRGGMIPYKTSVASGTSPIIGLFNYARANSAPNNLLRVTPSKLELLTGSSWGDKTGAALNGTSLSRPQFTIQNDILVFTMDGACRPIGFGTNSGVGVAYTTGTQLGGTPPFAKCLVSYMQFLLLGNISDDGSYATTFDGWRTIEYSDDPFYTWTNCNGNTIDLYQTPGDLMAMKVLGRVCMCYKTDGVIRVTWIGSAIRFTQELIPGSVGTIAPLSVVDLGPFGHAYLGTDGVIYNVTPNAIQAVTFETLSRTLPPLLRLSRFKYARGFNIPTQDIYLLLYDRTGLTGQFLDSYVTWNYRTQEVTKGTIGQQVIAGTNFQPTYDSEDVNLVSMNDLVQEFDSANNQRDDYGVGINKYWTTGWHKLAEEEGYLHGVIVEMRKSAGAQIKISVARDMFPNFEREQSFTLKTSTTNSDIAECFYRFPSPVFGSWFNVKVRYISDSLTATTEQLRIGFIAQPKHKYPGSPQRVNVGTPGGSTPGVGA